MNKIINLQDYKDNETVKNIKLTKEERLEIEKYLFYDDEELIYKMYLTDEDNNT